MNNEMLPFEECPIGMFMSDDGELCLKTEYGLEAYIVSSGERFWGGADTLEKLRHVKVCPVEVEPVRRVHENNDLISRKALVSELEYYISHSIQGSANEYAYIRAKEKVEAAPAVAAAPARNGAWVEEIEPNVVTASGRDVHLWRCSACGFTWANKHDVLHYFKHCPNCGAKMDKGWI